jgi:hypothetical protein
MKGVGEGVKLWLAQYTSCYSFLLSLLFNKPLRFGAAQTLDTISVTVTTNNINS